MTDQAIFRSTSQALHFAFLIEAYPTSIESVMQKAIRRLLKELGIWDSGEPSSVDFGGLNALEVRAQCAMIRAAVRSRLPGPEAWAIQARYGINEIITAEGKRRAVFSRARYNALLRLGSWLSPSFQSLSPMAVTLLVARAVDKRVCDLTCRQMAGRFGGHYSTYAYAQKRLLERIDLLEKRAIDRLDPVFVADGVVRDFNVSIHTPPRSAT